MRLGKWGAVVLVMTLAACGSSTKQIEPAMYVNIPSVPHCESRTCSAAIPQLAPNAPPRIVHLYFPNGLAVRRGSPDDVYLGHEWFRPNEFLGTISTSSNVASVELRTNLFSINTAKKDIGRFEFDVEVVDVPSIFIRPYTLRVIARNTRGDETEEDVPLRIQ